MKLAIIGATGLVGSVMRKVLEEQNIEFDDLYFAASHSSIGKELEFKGVTYNVKSVEDVIDLKPNFALFSAGAKTSKEYAERFAEQGTFVIDNSSAWRMDVNKKLIVPEINGSILSSDDKIIANPNCSTIQMVAVLGPLHKQYKIKRIVVSTYQSVTGTGVKAVEQLNEERKGNFNNKVYPYQIDLNCFPHGGDFLENGYTTEEIKLVNETRKILGDDTINITSTVVRIPVFGGHSEAVNIEFENEFELKDIYRILGNQNGIIVQDDTSKNEYPMPLFAMGKDDVFVGRIRRDFSQKNSLNIWIVADNLRKGAATNAIQIMQYLINNKIAK
ncbi:MAG: aspartate-semialdehyde dehydrogenase [Bacteroidetes bacterium GWF2_29_10]|nr:MAG: aspartate-semialdehyde dehydrogenase [Bacteroidetes bacterium GWF2_29_10]